MPSVLSTLTVLPLPYGAHLLLGYLVRAFPTVRWKRHLANFIIATLLLSIVTQVSVVGIFFYLGLAGGGLDFMLSWQIGILLEAIVYALPITILVTLITILIFLGFEEKPSASWLLLPAIVVNGMAFVRLGFLYLGIPA